MIIYFFKCIILDVFIWNIRLFVGNCIFLIIGIKPKSSMYAGGKNKSDMFGCGYILISKCSDPYNTGNKAYVFPVSYCLWDLYLNTFEKV